jgi:hypothetical protein
MSNQVFPAKVRGLDFFSGKSPELGPIIQPSPSGVETTIATKRNPIWHWTLAYNILRDDPANIAVGLTYTDLRTMLGFYLSRGGQADNFLYSDPDDNSVTNQELPVVTDGEFYYSPLQRDFGGFMEDIDALDSTIPLVVKANGVTKTLTTHYTVEGPGLAISGYSYRGLYLKWVPTSPAAAPADPVTATFGFYHRVRFEEDKPSFERFWKKCWTLGGGNGRGSSELRLMSSRPPAL